METYKIMAFNAEGITRTKCDILSDLRPDILCLQETHKESTPPNIRGMHLIVHHEHPKHGSAIYARDKTSIISSVDLSLQNVEILRVETAQLIVMSVYKPPTIPFAWPQISNSDSKPMITIGDFNSHNTIWGYTMNDTDGEAVENWAASNNFTLLHNPKDKCTFMSARWRKGYNPDLAFVSSRHFGSFERTVNDPIPKSQHRPVTLSTRPAVRAMESNGIPRFNFRKANWESFTKDLDDRIQSIEADPVNYATFQKLVWDVAKKNIPRGCRKTYIPCLNDQSKELYKKYTEAFNRDPLSEDTVQLGEELVILLAEERSERWKELITSVDMTQNSKKAWSTIKKINSEKRTPSRIAAVTPDEVANQLLLNGKPSNKEKGYQKRIKAETAEVLAECDDQFDEFTLHELESALSFMKTGKACGLDGITTEEILHFGLKSKCWILNLFNKCASKNCIPKEWRKAKVVALLKPGKDPTQRKSYRPISLLCILYKLFERMILARIAPSVEEELTSDQAGFRPGRSTCGQLLNLTQFIEDGYEKKQATGTVFVDLTAAYDTVNHKRLLTKVARVTKNKKIVLIVKSLLENRRFFVELDGRKSRWRNQKNGLPQGSVLAPTLFNVYTNDQPEFDEIRRFIYADDLCLATQSPTFELIETRLTEALEGLTDYYTKNSLNANPGKTQVCAFHLNNHAANKKLNITWNGQALENDQYPKYLGVTLDRTLSFAKHVQNVKAKVTTRNNLLSKLANSTWGSDPKTLRTTAMALCYSSAEYASPVWGRSCHAKNIDPELNNACRIITGQLRPTPISLLYRTAGIAPPHIRREIQARTQKHLQENDTRHPMYDHQFPALRLKSRKSFRTVDSLDPNISTTSRLTEWTIWDNHPNEATQPPDEGLPTGTDLQRKDWVSLNRARAKVGRTVGTLHKWNLSPTSECPCGHPNQTVDHILSECPQGPHCSDQDLRECNDKARVWITHWRDKL